MYVDRFEREFARFVGAQHAVCVVNGTAAIHVALQVAGVRRDDEVITQPLSFVATCNAISYAGAHPVFVDVDSETLGLSPDAVAQWLDDRTEMRDGCCTNIATGRRISACVPMHTFGHIGRVEALSSICRKHNISMIEDAAESVGSSRNDVHSGRTGLVGAFSFNGNKIITTGGGGMLATDDERIAAEAKHLTTTAKVPHPWEYVHDEIGYNYRLPNLNAALGCAQLERLPAFVAAKRWLFDSYQSRLEPLGFRLLAEPPGCHSNYWLNAVIMDTATERDQFLECTNREGVMTRPVWRLLNTLTMYEHCETGPLETATWLADRVVNIPSSVPPGAPGRIE
jgi:perosamine synthetase